MDKDTLTFTSDGFDVVIWKGEEFVTNVGANRLVPANVETVAFDCEVQNAQEICLRWNKHVELKRQSERFKEALKDAAREFAKLGHSEQASNIVTTFYGFDRISLNRELRALNDSQKIEKE